ncbi:MAG: hypothetical protein LWW98_11055 [Deltaproteobacteria bacterium]|nr:hypothetical protein [Deltaproteobacteria bacterium]
MKKIFVILLAIMLAMVFAIPASASAGVDEGAVEWNFYGSVRMQTFSSYQDKNASENGFDDRDTRWALNPVSHIGAKVHKGNIGGCFEYGNKYDYEYDHGHGHDTSDVTLRKIYGTWDFGVGELTVGKTYTPIHFVTNQVYDNDYGLRGFGGFYVYDPMIQVKIDGFKLALVSPNTEELTGFPDAEDDTIYPKVEASYTFAMDTFSVKLFGGWNAYEVVDQSNKECDVTSYIYGVAGVVNAGPITLKAMAWNGQNVNLYGLSYTQEVDLEPEYENGDIRDNKGYGGVASIGVKINDFVGIEAGYGYVSGKDDSAGKDHNDEAWAAYLQAPITLAQGVTVVPEIGHYDYEEDEDSEDQGHESYFGAKWQINF